MIYITSDLHGYPLPRFLQLLRDARFQEDDFLFVLGDVIDRSGDGGIQMLQWMMEQPNVQMILGNHEAMLLSCDFIFDEITQDSIDKLSARQFTLLTQWLQNGAQPTIAALNALRKQNPDALSDLLDFLRDLPLYESVSVNQRDFLLVHAGLDNFAPKKSMTEYAPEDLLWHRPTPDTNYFPDITTILGHTPTEYYGANGKVFRAPTWIDIDCTPPVLLRLDDMREFYGESPEE